MSGEALARAANFDIADENGQADAPDSVRSRPHLRLLPTIVSAESVDGNLEILNDPALREGVDMVLDRAQSYPLLSAFEEKQLGTKVQAGLRASERIEHGSHSSTEERQKDETLAYIGKQAQEKFAMSNVKWLASRTRYYHEKHPRGKSYTFADIFMAGYFGLDRAIKKFDPTLGNKFSTYSTLWIDSSIERTLDEKASTVHIPTHIRKRMRKRQKLEKAGRTLEEQCVELGVDQEELQALRQFDALGGDLLSLEKPLSEDAGTEINLRNTVSDVRASEDFERVTGTVKNELGVAGLRDEVVDALCKVLSETDLELVTHVIYGESIDQKREKAFRRLKSILDHPAVRAELKAHFPEVSQSWQDKAACREDAELFLKGKGNNKEQMRAICGGCAVRKACGAHFEAEKPAKGQWIDGESYESAFKKKRAVAK
jgi:RNA polymerase sigma factor (sigma-70 family)